MSTEWTLPTLFEQYAESGAEEFHLQWDDTNNFSELINPRGVALPAKGVLFHIARSPKHDLKNKTYYLKITGFNFQNIPEIISGIEVKLIARRHGRATDDAIQLCLDGKDIGDNKASLLVEPEKIYGNSTDLWNTQLTPAMVNDPSFGIIIRFQAHPRWPHRDPILIDAVEMRIH